MNKLSRRSFVVGSAGLIASTLVSAQQSKITTITPVFERERFIDDIKQAFTGGQAAVEDVIAHAVSNPSAVMRDLGEPNQAAIELLYREDNLSIFNVVWPPLTVLVPHDHLMWAAIGVYTGREDNTMWSRTGNTIEPTNAATIAAREVFSLPPDAIHSVVNPVQRYTAAIHVYGGDLTDIPRSQWDALTLREKPFDTEEGRRILEEADRRASSI